MTDWAKIISDRRNMSLLPNDVSDFQSLRLYDPSLKTVSIYFKNLDGIIPSTGDSTFYTINP